MLTRLRTLTPGQILSLVMLAALGLSACGSFPSSRIPGTHPAAQPFAAGASVRVVAAENFYGDIVQQLGGAHVTVVSILSDPNLDPHEYESSVPNAIAVSQAQLVVENGGDYDTWMDKLLGSSPNPHRVVLVAADFAGHKLPDNPHFWYSLDDIQDIARAVTASLEEIDPVHKRDYEAASAAFVQSLVPIRQKLSGIGSKYRGSSVGLTETIFLYQSESIGLNVLTPFEFQKAIAEGNDPPADAVVATDDQLINHQVKILIYNVQTVTPITVNLTEEAAKFHVPVVRVSETMPPGKHYQDWMLDQLAALQQALGG